MRHLALVDINNFYVSAETVFNPKLKDKVVVVLSNNDGCAVARSNPAKALGIKMGEPWFKIKTRFKPGEVIALSSCYSLYADMSNRVVSVLRRYSADVEVYSVDESFLDMTHLPVKNYTAYGREIRRELLLWTGLPSCVGIASTKTLTKVANHCAKKRPEYQGVCNFNEMQAQEIDAILASLPVGDVWGVGHRLSARLNAIGIKTALDLKHAHKRTIRETFSVVLAKTIEELNGNACLDLEMVVPPNKNIASTRSFGMPVSDRQSLRESVSLYASQAAEKARKQNTYANSLTVFIHTSPFADRPFYSNSQTVALPSPSNDTRLLVGTALWILDRLYRSGFVYQKAGVILNDLVPSQGIQQDLFFSMDKGNSLKSGKLMSALDAINQRYGRQTIRVASQGFRAPWQMKQNMKSPDYTTDWDGLVKVF